jgi:hypothetical protein
MCLICLDNEMSDQVRQYRITPRVEVTPIRGHHSSTHRMEGPRMNGHPIRGHHPSTHRMEGPRMNGHPIRGHHPSTHRMEGPRMGSILIHSYHSSTHGTNGPRIGSILIRGVHIIREAPTKKCLSEYVRICARLEATAGYPFLRGQDVGLILKPCCEAKNIVGCSKPLRRIGKPSYNAPRLSPSGCITPVLRTAVLPVWQ